MGEEYLKYSRSKFNNNWNYVVEKYENLAKAGIHEDELDMETLLITDDRGFSNEKYVSKVIGKCLFPCELDPNSIKKNLNQVIIQVADQIEFKHDKTNISRFISEDDADSISLGSDEMDDDDDFDDDDEDEEDDEDGQKELEDDDDCTSDDGDGNSNSENFVNTHDAPNRDDESLTEVDQSLVVPIAISDAIVLNNVPDSILATAETICQEITAPVVYLKECLTSSQLINMQLGSSEEATGFCGDWMNNVLDLRCNKNSIKDLPTTISSHSESQIYETLSQPSKHGRPNLSDALYPIFVKREQTNFQNEKTISIKTVQTSDRPNILNQTFTYKHSRTNLSTPNLSRAVSNNKLVSQVLQSSRTATIDFLLDHLYQIFISKNLTNLLPSYLPEMNKSEKNQQPKENINPNNNQININRSSKNSKNTETIYPRSSKCHHLNSTFNIPKLNLIPCRNNNLTSQEVSNFSSKNVDKFSLTKMQRNSKSKLDETFLIHSEKDESHLPTINESEYLENSEHTNYRVSKNRMNISQALWTASTNINISNGKIGATKLDFKTDLNTFVENENFTGFTSSKCPLSPISQRISKAITLRKRNKDIKAGSDAEDNRQISPFIKYVKKSLKESKSCSTRTSSPDISMMEDISCSKIVPTFVDVKALEIGRVKFKEARDIFLKHFYNKHDLRSEKVTRSIVNEKSESAPRLLSRNIPPNNFKQNSSNKHFQSSKNTLGPIFLDNYSTNSKRNCPFNVSSDGNLTTDVPEACNETTTTGRRTSDVTSKGGVHDVRNESPSQTSKRKLFETPLPETDALNKISYDLQRKIKRLPESIKNVIHQEINNKKTNGHKEVFSTRGDQLVEGHSLSQDNFNNRKFHSKGENQLRKNGQSKMKLTPCDASKNKNQVELIGKMFDVSYYEPCSLLDDSSGEGSDTKGNANTNGKSIKNKENFKNCCPTTLTKVCLVNLSKYEEDSLVTPWESVPTKLVLKRKCDDVYDISNDSDTLYQLNDNSTVKRRNLVRPDRKCSYTTRARANRNVTFRR